MPRKDPAARPNPPSEKHGKTITMDLPDVQANQLRWMASKTGLTQAHLRKVLSESQNVADAITSTLKERLRIWKQDLGDDLFAGPAPKEEEADATS